MSSQQYSLRWNNHQPNFISVFTELLKTKALVDCTLAADGKRLQAHRVVLSACSTYFQALFVENPSRHPIVILKDTSFDDLQTIIEFMYYGEVSVTEEQLPRVLEIAKNLKIKGLIDVAEGLTRRSSVDCDSENENPEPPCPIVPASSPLLKQCRRRKSSTESTSLQVVSDDRPDDKVSMDALKNDFPLNNMPQKKQRDYPDIEVAQRRMKEFHEDRNLHMQAPDCDINSLPVEHEHTTNGLAQGHQWTNHLMDQNYRYSNSCINMSNMQSDSGMYMNNIINSNNMSQMDMGEYKTVSTETEPSPGPSFVTDSQMIHDPSTPNSMAKRRRTTNPQAEEKFQRALQAVRDGGIGFCKAAKIFGVNNRTLWLEFKKLGYTNSRPSIRNRIKKEHSSPPPEANGDMQQQGQQVALICPPHPVPVGFIDSRTLEFPLQNVAHNQSLNILGVNFNMQ